MSPIHLYTAPLQPATRIVVDDIDPPLTITHEPRQLIRTDCCHRKRWAMYVQVQVYADSIRRWCAPSRGCKGAR